MPPNMKTTTYVLQCSQIQGDGRQDCRHTSLHSHVLWSETTMNHTLTLSLSLQKH